MSYNNGYNNGNNGGEDTREVEAMRKMFVGGLNRETTEDTFFDYFGQFGTMVDKVIIKDPNTKTSRGFGFITYDQSDCVESAFQSRPHCIDGKTLDVKRAMPRDYNTSTAHAKTTKLFIGGVTAQLAPEELQTYIESRHPTSIGTVDKIDFLKDKTTNQNKGFGFLECSSTDFADRLTISENQFMIKGKSMSLKKAEPKPSEGGGGAPPSGGFRGRGGSRGGRGGRGGGRGNFNQGGGYGQNNSYNNQSTGGQYGNSGGNNYNDYNQAASYDQGYGGQQQQGGYNQQQGGYNQQGGGYNGNQQSGYGGYGSNNQQSGGYNTGSNDRYQPY